MFNIATENSTLATGMLLFGFFASFFLSYREFQLSKQNSRKEIVFLLVLPLFYMFFSHLLYCFIEMDSVLHEKSWLYFFSFWNKGAVVYGGVLGILLASLIFCKKDFAKKLDKLVLPLAIFIAFYRLSEMAMGQGYGEYWEGELTWFTRFPVMLYDKDNDLWAWAVLILSVIVLFCSAIIVSKSKPRFSGDKFLLFLSIFSSSHIFIESLRRDEFIRWGFVRVEQLLSALVILIILLIYSIRNNKASIKIVLQSVFVFIIFTIEIILLEFSLEDRISFLRFLDVSGIYITMFVFCVLLLFYILYLRKLLPQRAES